MQGVPDGPDDIPVLFHESEVPGVERSAIFDAAPRMGFQRMGLVIGMDEAGYGPNLGPLVVTATVWEVAGVPEDADFWSDFAGVISQSASCRPDRLHVTDSKVVYSPSRGLEALEAAVLCLLQLRGTPADSFQQLRGLLTDGAQASAEPWYLGRDVSLPVAAACERIRDFADIWRECCSACGIHVRAIESEVVDPRRFNELTRAAGSKGLALSRISLRLLRRVWDPDSTDRVLILADKHGGRNRYDELLSEVLDGQMVFRQQEGRSESRYRVGESRLRFAMKAESHFPVAVSSMISKYLREVAMMLFNEYWMDLVPGLMPTKGYPVDARRFKQDIAAVQCQLGLPDDLLWRER